MIDRLKDLAGSIFPTAAQIVAFGPGELHACGFSAAKAATIQAIAQGALSGVVPTRAATDQMDDEAPITRLVSVKCVGRWTVEMLLMYPLERMDVLPASDFGVREDYRVLKALPEQPKPAALRELATNVVAASDRCCLVSVAYSARAVRRRPKSFLESRPCPSNLTTRYGVLGGTAHT